MPLTIQHSSAHNRNHSCSALHSPLRNIDHRPDDRGAEISTCQVQLPYITELLFKRSVKVDRISFRVPNHRLLRWATTWSPALPPFPFSTQMKRIGVHACRASGRPLQHSWRGVPLVLGQPCFGCYLLQSLAYPPPPPLNRWLAPVQSFSFPTPFLEKTSLSTPPSPILTLLIRNPAWPHVRFSTHPWSLVCRQISTTRSELKTVYITGSDPL